MDFILLHWPFAALSLLKACLKVSTFMTDSTVLHWKQQFIKAFWEIFCCLLGAHSHRGHIAADDLADWSAFRLNWCPRLFAFCLTLFAIKIVSLITYPGLSWNLPHWRCCRVRSCAFIFDAKCLHFSFGIESNRTKQIYTGYVCNGWRPCV